MIKVSLIAKTDLSLETLASHAGKTCYNPSLPVLGDHLNVKSQLFDTSHHTTLEHNSYTFSIEGISVAEVTFGLHLTHPLYVSDQRSGRFCADMFTNPDLNQFDSYIAQYWPEVSTQTRSEILDYISFCLQTFNDNMPEAIIATTEQFIKERPFYPAKSISATSRKVAQEQLRSFVPVIFPTALDYTIDFITLVSLYKTAWTPIMREITQQMVDQVITTDPFAKTIFDSITPLNEDWSPSISEVNPSIDVIYKPSLTILNQHGFKIESPSETDLHPIDCLHFHPKYMNMNTTTIKTEVEVSIATFGQDQRHRTIKRSAPIITKEFYLPPILSTLNLKPKAIEIMKKWFFFKGKIPDTLFINLAPYGAVVQYHKNAPVNALLHESAKRLCFNAQEEIYHLSRSFLLQFESNHNLVPTTSLAPACQQSGKCAEGSRYCGRKIDEKARQNNYFPTRKI